MTKPDDSHIDEMREAIRGDFERSRRSSPFAHTVSVQEPSVPQPTPDERAAPAPRRLRFWRRRP